jgi:hypothetical protein
MKEQIKEIAKVLCEKYDTEHCKVCDHNGRCMVRLEAELVYEAGYRKQSEPISCGHEKGGEWEQSGLRNPKCSLCRTYNYEKSNYCPNCGAKMKGGAE